MPDALLHAGPESQVDVTAVLPLPLKVPLPIPPQLEVLNLPSSSSAAPSSPDFGPPFLVDQNTPPPPSPDSLPIINLGAHISDDSHDGEVPWTIPETNVVELESEDWGVPDKLDPQARYLSYLPHSGFHNQRLAIINALTLAKILNRTLLVPPITLGAAVGWVPSPKLQANLEQAETSDIADCRQTPLNLRRAKCGLFWKSRRASWAFLLSASALSARQNLIHRLTVSRSWFQAALGIKPNEIYTIPDRSRRSFRLFDTNEDEDYQGPYPYEGHYTMDELKALDSYKLIELGSAFGGTRLRLRQRENKHFFNQTRKLMAYKNPMLDGIASSVVTRLGGKHNYNSAHLRIGGNGEFADGGAGFAVESRRLSSLVWRSLIEDTYSLPSTIADQLLAAHAGTDDDDLLDTADKSAATVPEEADPLSFSADDAVGRPSSKLTCPGPLYEAGSPLEALNKPLFLATDGSHPRSNPRLALFRKTFPCAFFLSDFQTVNNLNRETIPELKWLGEAVDRDGEKLLPFLIPFVDGIVAAQGKVVQGTPTSTFSAFVKTVLHDSYTAEGV